MSEAQNIEVLKAAYAAFDRGDAPAVLRAFAPDIEWNWPDVPGIPHAGRRRGHDEVARCFEALAGAEEPIHFSRDEFIAQGDCVIVRGTYRARARATGRTWESGYVHVWTMKNGLATRYELQYDTAAALAAYGDTGDAAARSEIARGRAAFLEGFNAQDIDRMSRFLTDDSVGMPPNRPPTLGVAGAIQSWKEGFSAATSRFAITPESLDIAGDVAIDRFHWTMDSTPRGGGAPVHDEGKCIWVWRRDRGAWKVAQAIWNSDLATTGLWSGAGGAR